MKKLLFIFALLSPLLHSQSQINSFQILRLGKQSTAPANPPINASYVYFDGTNVVCVTSAGASCLASSGGSGTVTSIATTSPIGGGTITGTGTLTCTTCVVASSPGSGVAHFAGSTQTVTSSAIVAADITSGTITGTQLSSSIALPNGATATTQSASDNSTKVATTAYVDRAAPAMVQLETHTAATSAELDFTTCISASYKQYQIRLKNIVPTTNAVGLEFQVSTNGGATYDSGANYGSTSQYWYSASIGGVAGATASGAAFIQIAPVEVSNSTNYGFSGVYNFFDPQAAVFKEIVGQAMFFDSSVSQMLAVNTMGAYQQTTAVNAFRFLPSGGGTLASGTITCYGVTP